MILKIGELSHTNGRDSCDADQCPACCTRTGTATDVEALMAEPRDTAADVPAISTPASLATLGPDWETEDAYWQSAYPERPYARADRSYEFYRAAYRYGTEQATRWRGREWTDAELDLREGWTATREDSSTDWEEIEQAVRDAWDHVHGRSNDDRTHIR